MSAPLRRLLALTLVVLSLLGGCSLPGTSAPTATPPPTATTIPATATAPPVVITTPSAAPATPTAAATPTVTRPVPPATPATPTARLGIPATPPTPATPVVGTFLVVQDARQACELTLPVGFAPTSTPGSFASADGKMMVTLQSLLAGPDDILDDLALPFVEAFIPTVQGYEQTSVIRLADSLRIDFTGNLPGRGNGSLYFRQFDTTVCVVTLFVAEGTTTTYESFFEALIATLRPKGVG
jgi:hypothetical protein